MGQLAAVKLNFSDVQQKYAVLNHAKDFEEALHQLDDAALDLRKTAHNLMPEILLQEGFIPSLALFCERMSKRAGFRIYFHLTGVLPELEPDAALSIYRIIQELIHNIIKHANATETLVQINALDSFFLVTVEDNGSGSNEENLQKGTSLKTVRSRINLLAGQLNISHRSGSGTTITIEFDMQSLKKKMTNDIRDVLGNSGVASKQSETLDSMK